MWPLLQALGALLVLFGIFTHARRLSASLSDDVDLLPRGAALLDPSHAQHAAIVRLPSFLSAAEIGVLEVAASDHRSSHPDSGFTLYLQSGGLSASVDAIVQRIHEQVRRIDVESWGLNAVHDLEGVAGARFSASGSSSESDASADSGGSSSCSASYSVDGSMRARTVEFHEYGSGKRQVCASHCDHGSLFTADVMLSCTGDFTGGRFSTTTARRGEAPVDTEHDFERGASSAHTPLPARTPPPHASPARLARTSQRPAPPSVLLAPLGEV
mmetsp:Transcript_12797/g.41540  ORF Transcript_12797/g.41540 Transcript_12797/m.41540 type:complete len:271 (-) Transcript_12797:68-880(-)